MKNFLKYFGRALSLPFMFGLMAIACTKMLIESLWEYILCGGEWINYMSKDEPKYIADIYSELVNRKEGQKEAIVGTYPKDNVSVIKCKI